MKIYDLEEQRKVDKTLGIFEERAFNFVILTISFLLGVTILIGVTSKLHLNTTVHAAATRTWDGGGGTNNWSDCVNWDGPDTCPTSVDDVVFNATSTKASTVDGSFGGTVNSVSINAGYSGTITLSRSLTTTANFSQVTGTFTSGANALDINGSYSYTGGTFTAPSTTMNVAFSFTQSGGGWAGNSTLLTFDGTGVGTIGTISVVNISSISKAVFSHPSGSSYTVAPNGPDIPLGASPTINGGINLSGPGALGGTGTITFNDTTTINSALSGFTGIIVNGSLTFTGAAIKNFNAYSTFTINGTVTLNSGSVRPPNSFSLPGNLVVNFAFATTAPNITFSGTGNGSITCNTSPNITSLAFSHTVGTKTVTGCSSLSVGANPTSTGSLSLVSATLTGTGTFTVNGNLTVNSGSGPISGFSTLNVTGNFTHSGGTTNLGTYTDLNIDGSLIISASGLSTPSTTTHVAGDISVSSGVGFTANGTVILDGGNQALIHPGSGSFNFHGLTKTVASAATLTFPVGKSVAIIDTLTLQGASGNLLSLVSSSPGSQWIFHPESTRTIAYLNVQDSWNQHPLLIATNGFNITNSGNNTGWNFTATPQVHTTGYTVSPYDDLLSYVDLTSGVTNSTTSITLSGQTVTGANGMALDPVTCTAWGMLNLQGQGGRELVTLNLSTGVATDIGNTGKKFAGMAFDNNGTLYGITGDGEAALPETLYTLNKSTGAPTLKVSLGNGDNGEAIVYNTLDGYMYHFSGATTEVFEKVNLSDNSVTNIPTSGGITYGEAFGGAHSPIENDIIFGDTTYALNRITTSGQVLNYVYLDDAAKGIALDGCVPEVNPNTPTNLAPTNHVNGSRITDTTPDFTFDLSDNDPGNIVSYRIQIDDTSNFSSPVVDYTSALGAQGNFGFTVGQAAGGGSYAVGSGGQTLADGSYYWQVKAIDNTGLQSSYATANGGSVAFIVDTTAPVVTNLAPTNYVDGSRGTDNTPTVTADISDTPGAGQVKYHIQIDDTSNFSSPVVDYTSALGAQGTFSFTVGQAAGSGSYTVGSGGQTLSDGSYYWQILGIDSVVNSSSYNTANGGSVAFIIDTTAPVVTNLAPTNYVDGSTGSDNTPTVTADISDTPGSGQVKYHIQIDDTSNFSSPVVDYTSALGAQGTFSFTVGQAAGSGSYSVGSNGQTLSDNDYYWRILGIDSVANASAYNTANGGSIAFNINTTLPPDAPTNLGPANHADGSTISDATPDFSFDLSDPNGSDTVEYEIQIDDTANFSSPLVDYTSALGSQGTFGFTVGQAAGSGTYTVGNSGQTLTNGSYYWQVKAFDNTALASSYTTANGGSIAFVLNITDPPNPPTNFSGNTDGGTITDTTPTFTFTLTDPNSGDTLKYEIQIDNNSDFSSPEIDYTSALGSQGTFSFTVGQALLGGTYTDGSVGQVLADGDYYIRIRVIDSTAQIGPYVELNSGNIAFTIDTTPAPGGGSTLPPPSTPPSEENNSGGEPVSFPVSFPNGGGGGTSTGGSTQENPQTITAAEQISIVASKVGSFIGRIFSAITSDPKSIPLEIGTAGAIAVAVLTTASLLPEISLIGFRIFGLLSALVLRKKKKYWGIVFDKNTNEPIPFALVRIFRDEDLIAESISDFAGRYSMLLDDPGSYSLKVLVSGYDSIERPITIQQAQLEVIEDFGLGKIGVRPNILKNLANYSKLKMFKFLHILLLTTSVLGLLISLYTLTANQTTLNIALTVAYGIILVINIIILRASIIKGNGYVLETESHSPIAGAATRIYDQKNLIDVGLTNRNGQVKFNIDKGEYGLLVSKSSYSFTSAQQEKSQFFKQGLLDLLKVHIDESGKFGGKYYLKQVDATTQSSAADYNPFS